MFITISNFITNWMCKDLLKELEEKVIRINELEEEVDELCYKVQELEVELENKEGDFEDLRDRFSQIADIIHE